MHLLDDDVYNCEICNMQLMPDYDPQYCCTGYDCGCQGRPNNPAVCSEVCYNKLIESFKK